MHSSQRTRLTALLCAILSIAAAGPVVAEQKPQVQFTIDLKPFGVAPDLFADDSESRYPQRGVIRIFWLGDDHLAVAFSTTRRWSGNETPDPLAVRLLIYSRDGKQQSSREWNFGAEGPEGDMTLEIAPGPDNSILAIHESNSAGRIPEGNFVQVLNPDTILRQDFYIPATSAWVPSILPDGGGLVIEDFFASHASTLTWWSGKPLKPGTKVDIPQGKGEVVAGPAIAARADCANPGFCLGVRVFRPGNPGWYYALPTTDLIPFPRVFLNPAALLIELRRSDNKQTTLVVSRSAGAATPLLALPHGLQISGVTSLSADGQRFAAVADRESGICGAMDFFCNQRATALIIDVPANRIIFQQDLSAAGGTASLSPDGKRVAIFDKGKVSVYALP